MTWEAVIAIVEIAGLLAVVISLIYVAVQVRQNSELIRQNTLVARSSMVHETSVFYARFFELIAENSDLAHIYRKGLTDQSLDPNEVTRFEALLEVYFTSLEDQDHQYRSGLYFNEDDDTDLVEYMAPAYRDMLSSRYGREWWQRIGRDRSTPSFYDKIEKILARWDHDSE
ncbi:MAG: hypothetical protein R3192_11055 [Woeseiaceae bacterium]|nr:hypothetical protein [Woeseiaceae bacterium]